MLFNFAKAKFYRSAYTDEIKHQEFVNLISVSKTKTIDAMNKILLSILALALFSTGYSQNEKSNRNIPPEQEINLVKAPFQVTEALDFTVTDTDGNTLHLFEALDNGKTVLLDFFFTTCSFCQQYAPIIEQVYQNTGAGSGDIYFWGLDYGDTDAEVIAYKQAYGVTNPCASGIEGNANAAIQLYIDNFNFIGYPTYTVICPDRTVYWDVNYPPNVNGFNQYFDNCAQNVLIADFTANLTEVCEAGQVEFSDASTGNVTLWDWTFEGGSPSSSTDQNPVVTYNADGVYDVELTISDGANTNTMTMEDYITVNAAPDVNLNPFDDQCVNYPAFELTGGLPAGGTYSGTGVDNGWFDPALAGIGTHTITYSYMDNNGCEAEAQQDIYVDACTGLEKMGNCQLVASPNPTYDVLKLYTCIGKKTAGELFISDMLGNVVKKVHVPKLSVLEANGIDLSNQKSGIYFVKLIVGDRTMQTKIVLR